MIECRLIKASVTFRFLYRDKTDEPTRPERSAILSHPPIRFSCICIHCVSTTQWEPALMQECDITEQNKTMTEKCIKRVLEK